jgi:hypothetical protein
VTPRRGIAALAIVAIGLAGASPAVASEVSTAELERLLASAPEDPAALSRLQAVSSVDGEPLPVAELIGTDPALQAERIDELERRLDLDAASPAGDDVAERARELAGEPPPAETQEQGEGSSGGDGFELGIPTPLALALAVLVVAIAAFVAYRTGSRALPPMHDDWAADGEGGDGAEPGRRRLLRLAEEAEREGDWAQAVRLRFRAALARLGEIGALELRPSTTPSEAARRLHSERADSLTADFEQIVYGGRPALADDSAAAREGWPIVIEEVERR